MKRFGANLFLLTLFLTILTLPVISIKATKVEKQEVLSSTDYQIEYMKQRIQEQEEEIINLKQQLEVKETTQSTQE